MKLCGGIHGDFVLANVSQIKNAYINISKHKKLNEILKCIRGVLVFLCVSFGLKITIISLKKFSISRCV